MCLCILLAENKPNFHSETQRNISISAGLCQGQDVAGTWERCDEGAPFPWWHFWERMRWDFEANSFEYFEVNVKYCSCISRIQLYLVVFSKETKRFPGGSHRNGLRRRLTCSSQDVVNQRETYRSSKPAKSTTCFSGLFKHQDPVAQQVIQTEDLTKRHPKYDCKTWVGHNF